MAAQSLRLHSFSSTDLVGEDGVNWPLFCKTMYLKIEDIFWKPLTAGRSVIHFTLLECKLKMRGYMLIFKIWHAKKVCRATKWRIYLAGGVGLFGRFIILRSETYVMAE